MKNFIKNNAYYFIGIVGIFLIWEIISVSYQNELVFPSIIEIIKSLKDVLTSGRTFKIIGGTSLRLLIAISTSLVVAFLLSFLSIKFRKIKELLTPLMALLKTTPIASIIIILLSIFGHQNSSIIISFVVILPIEFEGFYNSFNNIDKDIKDELKLISKTNFLIIKDVYFPIAKTTILTTFLQSFSLGLKSLVMAEVLTMPNYSIGKELLELKNNLDMAGIMSWTFLLVIITIILEIMINKIKTRIEKKEDY